MFGDILVILGVCALVAIYMSIVHAFLRAAEEDPENIATRGDEPRAANSPREAPALRPARHEQWAH